MILTLSLGPYPDTSKKHLIAKYLEWNKQELSSHFKILQKRFLANKELMGDRSFVMQGYLIQYDDFNFELLALTEKLYLIERISWALELRPNGHYRRLVYSHDIQKWYQHHNKPYEVLGAFIYLRRQYLKIPDIDYLAIKLTTSSIKRVERFEERDLSTVAKYIGLINALLYTKTHYKMVHHMWKHTVTKEFITNTRYQIVEGVPREWIIWGENLKDMTPVLEEYVAIRKDVLKIPQQKLSKITGIKQPNISSLEHGNTTSKANFIKYCYYVAKLKAEQAPV